MDSRAKIKQLQKKEAADDGTMYYGGMGTFAPMDPMGRNNMLMRSNSLGHNSHSTGFSALPPELKQAMTMGLNGPLTPASSPSDKTGLFLS
jgi:hypothetical protein